MIQADTKALEKQLEEFELIVQRKLEGMVAKFAGAVAQEASENTPKGDNASIDSNTAYREFYERRAEKHGLPMEAGYHQSAWEYSEGQIAFNENTPITTPVGVGNDVEFAAESQYKIGDRFFIGAAGPDFTSLGSGVNSYPAETTIKAPTVDQIQGVIQKRLDDYYRSS